MRKIGPMKALDQLQDPQAPWIILFHGFGADASDLQPLAELIPHAENFNFLFPQGVLEVPIGPGWTGRAWWPINMERLQQAQSGNQDWDTSIERPDNIERVRHQAMEMIKALGIPWNKIILGGFSQGGMLAVDLALHAPEQPMGLILMSTALVNKAELKPLAPQRQGLSFFQSHGESDQVLTLKNGQRLETLLTQSGMKGRLLKFRGGHEIPTSVLLEIGNYLKDRLS